MIAITCSACQKKLSVKDGLAGKKAKCPACGQVTPVPAGVAAAAAAADEMRTLPPAPVAAASNQDLPTILPKVGDLPTDPSASKPEFTKSSEAPDDGHDSSLTDFLAPPQADDELGRLGGFRILKILGHGGMGVVFLGEDPLLHRKVAIKAMLPHLSQSKSSQERFLREARAAAALEHDHIVAIHHVGEDRGAPYIVMPLLKGEPLDERLKRAEQMPLADVLRIGREVAKAVSAAHQAGLIHRDIKPANIWLEAPEGRVKILDFGLARAASQDSGLTQQGAVIGTPAYMAPEQARGDNVDARCDLFSLGVVLYRMSTGKLPFVGRDTVSTLMEVAMHEPAPPVKINRNLPKELSDLVMKLLEKDLAKRMASAGEVVQALQGMERELAWNEASKEKTQAAGFVPSKKTAAKKSASDTQAVLPTPARRAEARKGPGAGGEAAGRPRSKLPLVVAAVLLVGLFGGGGTLAAIVYYWQTNNGVVRIEINDPNIQVAFDRDGQTFKGLGKHDLKVKPGEFGLHIERDGLKFDTDKFILKKGETIALKIEWLKEGKLQVVQGDKVIASRDSGLPAKFTNTLGMEFVLVPKGKSWLGGGGGKAGDKEVEIMHDFYLGKYEVTQEEWGKVMGAMPSHFSRTGGGKKEVKDIPDAELERFPMDEVSWDDAQLFLGQLNKRDKAEGWIYRLPTEVEWEYACRGGPMTDKLQSSFDFYLDKSGVQLQSDQANIDPGKGLRRTCKVGSYRPNSLGLYDMHGNVWEWCDDLFDPKDKDPRASRRVLRGGGWLHDSGRCLAAHCHAFEPFSRSYDVGLRVARVPVGKEPIAAPPPPEKKAEAPPPTFTNSLGMEFVLVPKGKFWMGGGGGRVGDTEVAIERDFYLGKYEVTQEEWERVTGTNPSKFKDVAGVPKEDQKRFPVETVSWSEAQLFLEELNKRQKEVGWTYRLPTSAEWEFACRGGPRANKFEYAFDFYLEKPTNQILSGQANFEHGNGLKRTAKVGSHKPNELGLHDMHGNVWEWVNDFSPPDDPKAPFRLMRGGSWDLQGENVSASIWRRFTPSTRFPFLGLRVARVPAGKELVKISPEEKKPAVEGKFPPLDAVWLKEVAAMPASKQVTAVADKLKERNKGYGGDIVPKTEAGIVVELWVRADNFYDIAPVRALTKLRTLTCMSTNSMGRGHFADLSALKGMNLTSLSCVNTSVSDLSPIKDMPLAYLRLNASLVSDLLPIKDMRLVSLSVYKNPVTDLSPLKNMKLEHFDCSYTPVSDLSPLKGMPLKALHFLDTKVENLSPLEGMQFTALDINFTKVADLTPLRNMKLTALSCWGTKVSDLSALKGMPLTNLNCMDTKVSDLSPLQGMSLESLNCNNTEVSSLASLKGMPLQGLSIVNTPVSDLSPLKDMKQLTTLACKTTQVADLSPLKGVALKVILCDFKAERDGPILRAITSLESINGKSVKDFWKEVDKK